MISSVMNSVWRGMLDASMELGTRPDVRADKPDREQRRSATFGAQAKVVDAGVGPRAAGEREVLVQLGLRGRAHRARC